MCCEIRGCFLTHFIILSISITVFLISLYGSSFLCGNPNNPLCYGKVKNMTLIYRNVTESDDFWQTRMYDKNMKYIFQDDNTLTEVSGYDLSYCLSKYELHVEKLEVGSTYLVYTFYYSMDNEWTWYLSAGEKLAIYQISYNIKLTKENEWEEYRVKRCFKPVRVDDAVMCYLAMSASVLTIIIEIIVIATMLPCKRQDTKRLLNEVFKS